ncbi:RHS repeat-associated core domain-containing protein [Paraburkholderia azotifigens]|uniref:RHS repeat domain-containing protein n=1 Tax=Paraburkholderia azotifigens TaxID=2057004 RepID=UPI003181C02F
MAALYFFQTDPNGAPVRMHDRDGNIAWAARFGAMGGVDSVEVERVQQPIRLQGQYFDPESNLHYNRHRYFDPSIGQFISENPLGLVGGLNPFSYGPNVHAWIDPLGLESILRFANRLRSAGKSSGAVSFLSIGTTTFKGVSGNARPADYHPQLRRVLDEIKHTHVVEDWHGYCAEVDAINKALKAGYSLNGATIKTLNVTVDKRHGKVKAVCKTCEPLTEFFGITPEAPPPPE